MTTLTVLKAADVAARGTLANGVRARPASPT